MIIFIIMLVMTSFGVLQVLSSALESAIQKNDSVYTEVEEKVQSVVRLVTSISNLEMMQKTDISLQERALLLRPFQDEYELLMVAVMDSQGNASSSLEGGIADLSDREYFQQCKLTRKTVVSDVIISRTTGEANIVIIHPILEGAEFKGAIFASILVTDLIQFTEFHSNYSAGYQTYIIDKNQNYLVGDQEGVHDFDKNRMMESKNKDAFFYNTNKGIFTVAIEQEPLTQWGIVTELNVIKYYSDVWLIMLGILGVIFTLIIVIINELKNQHRLQIVPLIEKLNRDDLTKVANRSFFEYEVKQWLKAYDTGVFILLDIDFFKQVNDVLGHRAGDKLLVETAKQLKLIFRKEDIVARFGGDEFAIFLPDVTDVDTVKMRCDQILSRLAKKYHHTNKQINVTASIGVVFVDEEHRDYEVLYEAADVALYEVKKRGRNGAVICNKHESLYVTPSSPVVNLREIYEENN